MSYFKHSVVALFAGDYLSGLTSHTHCNQHVESSNGRVSRGLRMRLVQKGTWVSVAIHAFVLARPTVFKVVLRI